MKTQHRGETATKHLKSPPLTRRKGFSKLHSLPLAAFALLLPLLAAVMPARADSYYQTTLQAFSPLGYWKLNETTAPNDAAVNLGSLGAPLNGGYGGFTSRAPVAGGLNLDADGAHTFNGSSTQVTIPYHADLNRSTAQTWSAEIWAKPANASQTGGVMSSGQPAADPLARKGWILYAFNNQWSFRPFTNNSNVTVTGNANGILSAANTLVANQWHHLVVVNDGTDCILYVNGAEASRHSAATYVEAPYGGTTIGKRFYSSNYFNGDLDECAFYSTALTPARIAAHYNEGITQTTGYQGVVSADSPVAYYRLGDAAGFTPVTAVNDGTLGATLNGTYSSYGARTNQAGPPNPPFTGLPAVSAALGTTPAGKVDCTNDAAYNVPAFSVTAWVKSDGIVSDGTIIGKGNFWKIRSNGINSSLVWQYPGGSATGTAAVADGNWHHIVATADNTGSALYVDGVLDASGAAYNGSFSGDKVFIGSNGDASTGSWLGTIDEVAFIGSKLTSTEVGDLYAARFEVVIDPPLYWAPDVAGGGSGTWSSSSNLWAIAPGIQGTSAQGTSGALIFGDTIGTVTINGTVTTGFGLKFSTDGYNLVPGTSSPSLSLTGLTPSDNTITVDPGVTTSIDAQIAGTTGLIKQGTGTLIVSAANTISGTAGINSGILQLNNEVAFQNATVSVNAGAVTFDSSVISNAFSFGGLAGTGAFSLVNNAATPIALEVGGNNASTNCSGSISGGGSLTKIGGGTLTLGGASSNYSGGTLISSGTIKPNRKQCFGSGQVTLAGGVTFNQTSADTGFEGNSASGAYPNTFNLSGGEVTFNVAFGGATDIWTNTQISGPGSIKVIGGGRDQGLTLEGNNTFLGGVTVAGPDTPNVSIYNNNSLGAGTLSTTMTSADLTRGGLRIQANLTAVPNAINLGSASSRLVVNTSPAGSAGPYTATFTGPVSGDGSFVKISNGTVVLSGTNTYGGATKVNGGTLVLDGTNAGSGALTVASGARLGGNGSTAAPVTLANGGKLLATISDWGGYAGTGFSDLEVASLDLTGSTWVVDVSSATSYLNFIDISMTFPFLTAPGGITGYDDGSVTVSVTGFPGTGTWDVQQNGNALELVYTPSVPTDYETWATNFSLADRYPTHDPDQDGMSNQQEYAFGLNPTSGSSVSPITQQLDKGTGIFKYTRRATPATTGLAYTYQLSTTLGVWQDFTPTSETSDSGDPVEVITVEVPAVHLSNPSLFVRVIAD